MVEYGDKYMGMFVPDQELKNSISLENPVPSNLDRPKQTEDSLKELIEEKRRRSKLVMDDNFDKILQKALNILGPLSQVWLTTEESITSTDDQLAIPLGDMIKYIEQIVMMVGKTIYCLAYNRPVSALTAVMGDKRRAKTTIREQSQLLERMDANLSGREFRKHITETAYAKKESKDVCQIPKMTTNEHFGAAPHFPNKTGDERQFAQRDGMNNTKAKVFQTIAKILVVRNASMKSPYLTKAFWKENQLIHLEMIPFVLLDKAHPWIKNLFKSSKVRNFPLAGKVQYFVKNLQCLTENPEILQWISCLRLQFLREPLQNTLSNQGKMN